MPVLKSKVKHNAQFKQNAAEMKALVEDLRAKVTFFSFSSCFILILVPFYPYSLDYYFEFEAHDWNVI